MNNWFEEFENRPVVDKSKIKWNFTKDFQVQSKSIKRGIHDILANLDKLNFEDLLKSSQYCYNLLSWMHQMDVMGFTGFQKYVDDLLQNEFGDKNIIKLTQEKTFNKWIKQNNGHQVIGENFFVILEGSAYYKKIDGSWWLVDNASIFDIFPRLISPENTDKIEKLDSLAHISPYQQIYNEWLNGDYKNPIPKNHYQVTSGLSDPTMQHEDAMSRVRQIMRKPIALDQFVSHTGIEGDALEYLIKLSYVMARYVQERRQQNAHTMYLLRDCVMFSEIHATLDAITKSDSSNDQLIVSRDLLTNSKRRAGHWYFSQEALFIAYEESPNDFAAFYGAYSEILSDYENFSPEFHQFVIKLAKYVDDHVPSELSSEAIIEIVDLGFQGSINMLLKYVIDNHCRAGKRHKTVINMTILAEWFKSIYPDMYFSNTYSLLTNIESLARNEKLYRYKLGSFENGSIKVVMGSKEEQDKANSELLVSTMTTLIAKNLNLV